MPKDQAVAVAYSMCEGKAVLSLAEDVRALWINAFTKTYDLEANNVEEAELAAWLAIGITRPDAASQVLERPTAKSTRVKALDEHRIGGYLIVWGDEDHTDLEGDYFTPESYLWLDQYKNQPLMYDHAMSPLPSGYPDDMPYYFQFGVVEKAAPDDVGVWIEAQVDAHNDWAKYVLDLINKGIMHWSSGSVPHLVKRHDDGWLASWPIVEATTTPTPAEPRMTEVVMLKHYVNTQDAQQDPEAALDKSAHGDPGDPVQSIDHLVMNYPIDNILANQSEEEPMEPNEVKARALVTLHWDQLAAQLKQIDEGMPAEDGAEPTVSAIDELIAPLATQLVELTGMTQEEAHAKLLQLVTEYARPVEESAPEEEVVDEYNYGEMMSVELDALDQDAMIEQIADAVAKKLAKKNTSAPAYVAPILPAGKPRGGYKSGPQNMTRIQKEQFPLTDMVKAAINGDYGFRRRNNNTAAQSYMKAYGRNWAYKALGTEPDTAGGYLARKEESDEIIEVLHDQSVLADRVDERNMAGKTLTINRGTTAITTGWIGENTQLSQPGDPAFGQEMLIAKKLYALVLVSSEEMEDTGAYFEQWLKDEISAALAEEYDRVILRGSGIAAQPLGLLNRAGVTKTALNAVPTYANLVAAQTRIKQSKVKYNQSCAWVINPRDTGVLRGLEDTAGNLIWTGSNGQGSDATMGQPGILLGWPVLETNQIDIDATDNNETEIYGGVWKDVIVGLRKAVEFKVDASRYFDYDQIAIRAIVRMDVGMRHDEAIEILSNVRGS
jgi:HK97 family phage major capsid protein